MAAGRILPVDRIADIVSYEMKKTNLQRPRIDALRLHDLDEGETDELAPDTTFEGQRLTRADVSEQSLAGATFDECELIDWSAHHTYLRGARFLQTRVERLNAPVLSALQTTWRDAEIDSSRLGALEWYDSDLRRLVVSGSKLGWVNLRNSTLTDVVFRGCTFEELDLSGASLTRVAFEDCTVDKLVLHRARAQHVDLRGAELRVIEGFDGLKAMTLSSFQATQMAELFATHLGILIEG